LAPRAAGRRLGTKIHERFRAVDGELQVPDRSSELPRAAEFDG
jgi:hypothetical protein